MTIAVMAATIARPPAGSNALWMTGASHQGFATLHRGT